MLRELVHSGEYGRMLDAQFLRLSACPRWSKSGWLFRREQSGHIPFDLHIHDLDLILSLWGEPESVSCTSTGREGLDYREHYRFSYVFPGGATVSAEAAWYNADIPFTATWRVYFESAVAVFDGEKVTVYAFDREQRVISTEEMLAASKFCPEFTLDTVYSRSAEKARAFAEKWGAPHWTDSLEALAASESVDAVYIASPNALHCEQTLLMLRGGKHVLCEKPIARCAVELETMLSAAQERGLVLLQAMRSAFLPTIPLLREEIARIGPVRRARFSYCQYSSRYDKFKNGIIENAFDPRLGNGALMDIGAYCVNLMVLLFGAPRAVTAKAVFLPGSIDALGTAICEYDGFHAELEYSKVDQSDCISEISGESGSLRFWPTAAPLNVVSVRKGKILELASDPCGEYDMRYELERFVLLTRGGDAGEWTECTRIAAGVMDEIRRQCGIDFTIH